MNRSGSSKRRFITYALAATTAALALAGPASAYDGSLLMSSSGLTIQTTEMQSTSVASDLAYLHEVMQEMAAQDESTGQTQQTSVDMEVLRQAMEAQAAQYTQLSNLLQSMYYTQLNSISNVR